MKEDQIAQILEAILKNAIKPNQQVKSIVINWISSPNSINHYVPNVKVEYFENVYD